MRTLVTGGAGFIGSHLVEALVEAGDDVSVLDDLSTGSLTNLASVADRVDVTVGSVADEELVGSVVRGVDRVFHLAATVGVELVARDPAGSLWANVAGTEHVADAASRAGAALLFASSSEVYGTGGGFPLGEEGDRVLGPTSELRWSYADGKAVGEMLVLGRVAQQGAHATVVRLFNTVGPRQLGTFGMVLPRFVQAALSGSEIEVYGDGAQTRSFCAVGDVVPAMVALVDQPAAVGRVVNLGSDREITMRDLADLVRDVLNSRSPIRLVPSDSRPGREIDFRRRVPDIGLARELVGFRAETDLADIILAVAESLR